MLKTGDSVLCVRGDIKLVKGQVYTIELTNEVFCYIVGLNNKWLCNRFILNTIENRLKYGHKL